MIRRVLFTAISLLACSMVTAGAQAPISADFARQLDARLAGLKEPDGCVLERIDTELATVKIGLKPPAGPEYVMLLTTGTGDASARRVGSWHLSVPGRLQVDCNASVAAIERIILSVTAPPTAAVEQAAAIQPAAPTPIEAGDLEVRMIQVAWIMLILAAPWLCWRAGAVTGTGGRASLLVMTLAVGLALGTIWQRGNEPLHANGHAWREAREVLMPWGARAHGLAPAMHGKGAIALQWLAAGTERFFTGRIDPFRLSRLAGAAAAAGAGLLALVWVRSAWAGAAAAATMALLPISQSLALSGSSLAITAWILPWSFALYLAAARCGDRALLGGAVLATALGTLSHTAMLAWAPSLVAAWLLVACREIRFSIAALAALLVLAAAWTLQFENAYGVLASRNEGPGLLALAELGFYSRNLLLDPSWVSPALLILLGTWIAVSLRRGHLALMLASLIVVTATAVPFFAVHACSSDAVRYQGALMGLLVALAVSGLWLLPLLNWFGAGGAWILRTAALIALVALPLPRQRQPPDPVTVEHQLVEEAVQRMQPGTLIVLPGQRFAGGLIIIDFPDFLLPAGSQVVLYPDPRIASHEGPVLYYLGLACVSWLPGDDINSPPEDGKSLWAMRPDCRAFQQASLPWHTRSLEDLPRGGGLDAWTFHRLATHTPFGFFEPSSSGSDVGRLPST